jgi:V-type H+-transporting ATPase subunit a
MTKPKSVQEFLNTINNMQNRVKKAGNLFFESIEEEIRDKEKFVQEQTRKGKEIHDSFNLLFEYKTVLKKAEKILNFRGRGLVPEQAAIGSLNDEAEQNEQLLGGASNIAVGHIAGTINKDEELRFKKLIFRATRGNALTYFEDFNVPLKDYYGNGTQKSVYVVIFQEGSSVREKIIKICDSFLGERFDIPPGGVGEKINEINAKINDARNVMGTTNDEVRNYLMKINRMDNTETSVIQLYKWFVIKEKALYENLNKLKIGDRLLVGLFWCPVSQTKNISEEIQKIKQDRNISGPQMWKREGHGITPPSYFKTNEFTEVFQEIVNTYGVPDYKEVNPAMFAIVTFPFLFGVMFGDIFHGFLLLLFGSFLCLFNEKLKDSALGALCGARYILLMMGFFAFFIGFCYNDFASIPLWTGSCFDCPHPISSGTQSCEPKPNCVHGLGVDPSWFIAENQLTFVNNMKMKMSVIFGVAQMSLGIFMKAFNAVHFGRMVDLFFEFFPQIILLWALFGWMNILIIAKWLTNWENEHRAPGIISVMINMFLGFGKVDDNPEDGVDAIIGGPSTQQAISIILLVTALICVPVMLLVKPLYLRTKMSGHAHVGRGDDRFHRLDSDEEEKEDNDHSSIQDASKFTHSPAKNDINLDLLLENEKGGEEHHAFSEIFIHQLIETIEFVLGTVSNTASYLRLWALSLAHSQLAEVFFDKLLMSMGLEQDSVAAATIFLFVLFPMWASFTLFVLMCMDSMECFLHTLRLHWVEFQNKFYKGNGYRFVPFSFAPILEQEKNNKD